MINLNCVWSSLEQPAWSSLEQPGAAWSSLGAGSLEQSGAAWSSLELPGISLPGVTQILLHLYMLRIF